MYHTNSTYVSNMINEIIIVDETSARQYLSF